MYLNSYVARILSHSMAGYDLGVDKVPAHSCGFELDYSVLVQSTPTAFATQKGEHYQKLRISLGQASTQRAHLMQSGFSNISFTGSCMGQTFWHLPHSMHFSLSTLSWYFNCQGSFE
jgi:hypothetical protein